MHPAPPQQRAGVGVRGRWDGGLGAGRHRLHEAEGEVFFFLLLSQVCLFVTLSSVRVRTSLFHGSPSCHWGRETTCPTPWAGVLATLERSRWSRFSATSWKRKWSKWTGGGGGGANSFRSGFCPVFFSVLQVKHLFLHSHRWKVQVASKGVYFRKPKVSPFCPPLFFRLCVQPLQQCVNTRTLPVPFRFCP